MEGGGLRKRLRRLASIGASALLATASLATATRADMTSRPDTYIARLQALALIETLNADILAARSATTALETWCGAHGMAAPAVVKAQIDREGVAKPATNEQRERLGVAAGEPIRHRAVRLACGNRVLSLADNWYVPSRLTPEMNEALETTDTSFGRVVSPLKPSRRTFATTMVWHPLPEGWEMRPAPADHPEQVLAIPAVLFEHHAVLYSDQGVPFSEVAERYTSELLNFARR